MSTFVREGKKGPGACEAQETSKENACLHLRASTKGGLKRRKRILDSDLSPLTVASLMFLMPSYPLLISLASICDKTTTSSPGSVWPHNHRV